MGPTLFLLFVNELPDALQSQLALYADNSTIFCSSLGRREASRTELGSMLDRDLAQVLAWGQDWIVTFNDRKTKLISVSRSKDRNFPAVHMGSQVLAYSEDLSILGMDISSDLSWGKYISGIAKSAVMRVGCLSHARKFIPPSALFVFIPPSFYGKGSGDSKLKYLFWFLYSPPPPTLFSSSLHFEWHLLEPCASATSH